MRYTAIILILIIIPSQAWAAGAFVAGCATGGPLATPMGVSAAATAAARSVSSVVKRSGRSINQEQKKIIATINKNFEAQNSLFRQIVASYGASKEKMENMRMFGPQSRAYGIGAVENRFNTVMSGRNAEDKLAGYFRDDLEKHAREFQKHRQRSLFYGEKEEGAVSPGFFFPQEGTLSAEELNGALFAIKGAVDPFPSPKLPEKLKGKSSGRAYEAERKVKYSRLAMPSAVISEIVSSYAPVMELGEWAEDAYERMGGKGESGRIVNGKISPMAYIDMMVNTRFANQEWYSGQDGIHGMTEAGLLREMLVMESVNMEMQRRQMKYMQQTAGLLAQDQAAEAGQHFNETLNHTFEKVMAQ